MRAYFLVDIEKFPSKLKKGENYKISIEEFQFVVLGYFVKLSSFLGIIDYDEGECDISYKIL